MGFEFKFDVMLEAFPELMQGAVLTVEIAFVGLLIGFALGVCAGLAKTSKIKAIKAIAVIYIESIRGTPIMVQVMFIYFGLPLALGMRIPPFTAATVSIAINAGAYIAEIVRGSIESIDKGQTEAGRSIGLSHQKNLLYVVWPQAFRRMIPPLGNQLIISIKDTALFVVIGVGELTRTGQEIIAVNFRAFEVWMAVALIYLAITLTLSKILNYSEAKLGLTK